MHSDSSVHQVTFQSACSLDPRLFKTSTGICSALDQEPLEFPKKASSSTSSASGKAPSPQSKFWGFWASVEAWGHRVLGLMSSFSSAAAGKVIPCLRHRARSLQKASIQHQAPCFGGEMHKLWRKARVLVDKGLCTSLSQNATYVSLVLGSEV